MIMRWFNTHKFLFVALLFISIGIFLDFSNWLYSPGKYNVDGFVSQLHQKERLVDDWFDKIENLDEATAIQPFLNNNTEKFEKLFHENGIIFAVFHNDSLVFWNSNLINYWFPPSGLQQGYCYTGNVHSEVKKRIVNEYILVSFVVIKYQYPYENDYLKNTFHPSFTLPCSAVIWQNMPGSTGSVFTQEGDYLFSLKPKGNCQTQMVLNFIFACFIVGFLFILLYIKKILAVTRHPNISVLAISIILISGRFLLQYYKLPTLIMKGALFNTVNFYLSPAFPSLGDLLISIALFTYLVFLCYTKCRFRPITSKGIVLLLGWFLALNTVLSGFFKMFKSLILFSNFKFEAYDILSLSPLSIVGYIIITIMLFGVILIIDKSIVSLRDKFSSRFLLVFWGIGEIIFALAWLLYTQQTELWYVWLIFTGIIAYWNYVRLKENTQFSSVIILVVLFTGFATLFIKSNSYQKRKGDAKMMAVSLASEQDPIAEVMLSDAIGQIEEDTVLVKLLIEDEFDQEACVKHLEQNYVDGYLKKYSISLTLCTKKDSLYFESSPDELFHCYSFFDDLILEKGIKTTENSSLWKLANSSGDLNYLMLTKIKLPHPWLPVSMYIELSLKPNFEVLGYPELLIEKPQINTGQEGFSHAKYRGNSLINKSGDYPYALEKLDVQGKVNSYKTIVHGNYTHVLYYYNEANCQIVSFPNVKVYNVLIAFTYIFLFFLVQVIIFLIFGRRYNKLFSFDLSIKNKIAYTIIAILFISLVLIGIATVFYTVRQFENHRSANLEEKLKSVVVELEHKLSGAENLNTYDPVYLNSILIKFSNVFFTDINLYDLEGKLLATSRKAIFNRKLTGERINPKAFNELTTNRQARVIQKEFIGELDYYSAYVPFINENNKLLAYLNLPYFSESKVLRQELLRVIVAIVNIYAFLVIIAMFGAIWISSKLTAPLREVQSRIAQIGLKKTNERITYKGSDEIAALVVEYNKMLQALDSSARLLAKSERESAWSEMARQIAHEIKNPLTPMKLSVQLLERAWNNQDKDFGERFQRITRTLIEQINSLSNIANEFSQFARLQSAKAEKVNLVERIETCVALYQGHCNAKFFVDYQRSDAVYILADKEKVLQVFNNIIKKCNTGHSQK
jgi:signal transduction histidine kinase